MPAVRLLAHLPCLVLAGCLVPDEAADPRPRGTMDTGADVSSPDAATGDATADAASDAGGADARADAAVGDAAPADATPPDAAPGFSPAPQITCPGSDGCRASPDRQLRAGASAVSITDGFGFESPLPEYLERNGRCNELQADLGRCGPLDRDFLRNCGQDRLCPGDEGYPGPDEGEGDVDGESGRKIYDYFRDCGFDGLCPGDEGYVGPDEGEGNRRFDGLWLAGFDLNRPALGVHDPVWARTVALEQGNTLVTLTSVDAVGLFYDDVVLIRERAEALLAERRPELDLDLAIITATHSHEVPDTMGLWAGEVDPEVPIPLETGVSARYIEHLRAQAALSIVQAVEALQPARVLVAEGRTGAEGLVRDSRPPIVINDTLGIVRLIDPNGNTIATLLNWGNHPEALAANNNYISSDFAGPLRDALENGVPATPATEPRDGLGGVAIFVQGTVGGLMTPLSVPVHDLQGQPLPLDSFARNEAIGRRVATVGLDALAEDAEEVEDPTLGFTATEFKVPVHNRLYHLGFLVDLFARRLYDFNPDVVINERNLPNVLTQIAILRLGPITLYTVPGELFPELAVGGYDGSLSFGEPVVRPDDEHAPDLSRAPGPPYLHDLMPGRYKWVVGLGQDELGYLVPPYDYVVHPTTPYLLEPPGSHYEETNSVGPQIVPRIQRVLEVLAAHLLEAGI